MIYEKKIFFILLIFVSFILLIKFATIPFGILTICIFFVIDTFWEVLFFVYKKYYSKDREDNKNILLDDVPIKIDSSMVKPVRDMIEDNPFSSSFSMALVGKWGSGKSSFLKTLQYELKDKYEVININAWQLENSANITHELKKELDNIIFSYSKKVWLFLLFRNLFIQDYFSILSKYLIKTPIKSRFTFEPTLRESKEVLYKHLTEALNGKKIILLVDELDRLNLEDDILNIFKVIHFTSSFDNIFVITAMDIEQIEKRITNIDYIHKIFNLKYFVPLVEKDEVIKYYKEKIFDRVKDLIKEDEFENIIKTTSVIDVISNYRIIKNSFNDTIIFISNLQKKHPTDWDKYISFKFIFILNLIKAIDFNFYSYVVLKGKIFELLEIKNKEDKEEELIKKDPLFENIYKSLNYIKMKNLLSVINNIGYKYNKEQCLDIYQIQDIAKYHITDSRYKEFIDKAKSIRDAFDKLEYDENKAKFLLNILYRLSSNKEEQKVLLENAVDLLLSLDEQDLRKKEFKPSFSFHGTRDYPHLDVLANSSFQKDENKEILSKIIKKNNGLSDIFISYLIENFINTKNHQEDFLKELLKKYIDTIKEDKDKKDKVEDLIRKVNSLPKNFDRELILHKVIYENIKELSMDFSHTFLENMYIKDIPIFLKELNVDMDEFIKDNISYKPLIGSSSQSMLGSDIKKYIKDIYLEN